MALNVIAVVFALNVGLLLLLGLILAGIYASRYKRVPPGYAMIIYGKRTRKGMDILTKGGRFIWPIFQSYILLPIGLRNSEYRIRNIYPRSIKNDQILDSMIKISYQMGPDEKKIRKAAINLSNLSDKQIDEVVNSSVEKCTRHEAGKIGIVSIQNDPDFLEEKVRSEVSKDLSQLGINIKTLSAAVILRKYDRQE
jgi:uncharacterized membrane protein YqiK